MNRILNISQTAHMLGVCLEKFRQMRQQGFPVKPLPYCKSRYDSKAIELYLDSQSNIKPQSVDYDAILEKRLAERGNGKNEIRH